MEQQQFTIKDFQAARTEEDMDSLIMALRQLETIDEPQQIVNAIDDSDLLVWSE